MSESPRGAEQNGMKSHRFVTSSQFISLAGPGGSSVSTFGLAAHLDDRSSPQTRRGAKGSNKGLGQGHATAEELYKGPPHEGQSTAQRGPKGGGLGPWLDPEHPGFQRWPGTLRPP
jgi:hypothetical protein